MRTFVVDTKSGGIIIEALNRVAETEKTRRAANPYE
jgi:hypothetical protein